MNNFNVQETVPNEYDFSTKFQTWIIAYCPDTDSWFCTNQRFFYYESPEEFKCEKDAICYFENHIDKFVDLTQQMHPKKPNSVFLENTRKTYILGVMHSVDKWLDGDELEQDEVNRAADVREKVLRIIEAKDAHIRELEKKLEQAYLVIGEVVDKPNPFTKE